MEKYTPPQRHTLLGGGFNPVEKYARQNGFIFPNFRGWKFQKNIGVATTYPWTPKPMKNEGFEPPIYGL